MSRIAGVNLPKQKRIAVGLTAVYGIGQTTALKILKSVNINPNTRVKDLTTDDEARIRETINQHYKVEGDLHRDILSNIKRLKEINSYRGTRHEKKLPVRGQRTKTNARTKRGKKMTVGSGRKKAVAKT